MLTQQRSVDQQNPTGQQQQVMESQHIVMVPRGMYNGYGIPVIAENQTPSQQTSSSHSAAGVPATQPLISTQ